MQHHQDVHAIQIVQTVKTLLKERGLKYTDLADHLNLSVAAVKRAMTIGEMPLSRLLSLCELLEVELEEVLALAKDQDSKVFRFSTEQEAFFAKNPSYLAFLFELVSHKLTPLEIQTKHKITAKSRNKYLNKLEDFGLIQITSKGLVKTKLKGTIQWNDHGPLGQTFSRAMVNSLSKRTLQNLAHPGDMFLRLSGWMLLPEDYRRFQNEYEELQNKYRKISVYNKKILQSKNCRVVSTMLIADYWDEPMFAEVKEISV